MQGGRDFIYTHYASCISWKIKSNKTPQAALVRASLTPMILHGHGRLTILQWSGDGQKAEELSLARLAALGSFSSWVVMIHTS